MSRDQAKPRKPRGGCLFRLLIVALLGLVIAFLALDSIFNLQSNLPYYAYRGSSAPLEVHTASGSWKAPATFTVQEMDHALKMQAQTDGATWRVLRLRRAPATLAQRAVAPLGMELNVIEFNPARFRFATSFREKFVPTTARERLETDNLIFAVTANFRDPKDKPLGLVVHDGLQRNVSFPNWTGYFFVKDGRPWFGPKSLFDETPGILTEASQGYPSLMRNHTVFPYVDLAPNKFFDGNKITYRALAGVRQNGTVVFILSGNGGVMNVAEIAAIAQKLNVQHATLLDGGRALQYSLTLGPRTMHFAAYNTVLDLPVRSLRPQRSPVYISVKPATP